MPEGVKHSQRLKVDQEQNNFHPCILDFTRGDTMCPLEEWRIDDFIKEHRFLSWYLLIEPRETEVLKQSFRITRNLLTDVYNIII